MRCIGHAGSQRVAWASGLAATDVDHQLGLLRERGLVALDEGVFGGWSLTITGRGWAETAIEDEVRKANASFLVQTAYRDFLPLNSVVMAICHDWQMQSLGGRPVANDHSDHRYDDAVLARLTSADEAAQTICERLADRLARFAIYGHRLTTALRRAHAGELHYVTDDLESYHNVWFQLHEDLLVTCGISREEEWDREA
jgi:hypothetical protein